MPVIAQSKVLEHQDNILDAALERFKHYGLSKTTMAEIAFDVNMSTANLYRYFKNKDEIALACSHRCLQDRTTQLENIANNTSLRADEKISTFFKTILNITYQHTQNNPNINELVTNIADKHQSVIHKKNNAERLIIEKILKQGIKEYIFEITDISEMVIAVHTSLHIFQHPVAVKIHDIDTLNQMASATCNLVLNGLYKKQNNHAFK